MLKPGRSKPLNHPQWPATHSWWSSNIGSAVASSLPWRVGLLPLVPGEVNSSGIIAQWNTDNPGGARGENWIASRGGLTLSALSPDELLKWDECDLYSSSHQNFKLCQDLESRWSWLSKTCWGWIRITFIIIQGTASRLPEPVQLGVDYVWLFVSFFLFSLFLPNTWLFSW